MITDTAATARTAQHAWTAAATDAWTHLTTDTREATSPAATAAADLAQWTSQLAASITGTANQEPARPAGRTASPVGDLQAASAAIHHACHTLAVVAAADHQQILTATAAGRLYVLARTIPGGHDIPCRFVRAPAGRTAQLLATYGHARTASHDTASLSADLVAITGVPSRIPAIPHAFSSGGRPLTATRPVREPASRNRPTAASPIPALQEDK